MKFPFLNVIDISLSYPVNNSDLQITRVVDSLNPCCQISSIIILLCSDLTLSGEKNKLYLIRT